MSPVRIVELPTGMTITLGVGRPLPAADKPADKGKA